jgi:hypothetical protein
LGGWSLIFIVDGTLMTLIGRMVADFFDVDNLAVIGMVTEFYLRLSARSASSVFYSGMERFLVMER